MCSLIQQLQKKEEEEVGEEEEGVKEGHPGPQLLTALNEWPGMPSRSPALVFQELTVQL